MGILLGIYLSRRTENQPHFPNKNFGESLWKTSELILPLRSFLIYFGNPPLLLLPLPQNNKNRSLLQKLQINQNLNPFLILKQWTEMEETHESTTIELPFSSSLTTDLSYDNNSKNEPNLNPLLSPGNGRNPEKNKKKMGVTSRGERRNLEEEETRQGMRWEVRDLNARRERIWWL